MKIPLLMLSGLAPHKQKWVGKEICYLGRICMNPPYILVDVFKGGVPAVCIWRYDSVGRDLPQLSIDLNNFHLLAPPNNR